jgi:MraZ protein
MAHGFYGTFNAPLDDKNRAVLPLRLREAVAQERLRDGFVITRGFEGCLVMFLREDWRALMGRIENLPFTSREARLFKRFFLPPALEVAVDRIGRVTFADFQRAIAGIGREAIFQGMADHIEIWAPARWEEYSTRNLGHFEEVAGLVLGGNGAEPARPHGEGREGRSDAEDEEGKGDATRR